MSQFFGLSLWFAPNAVFVQLVSIYNFTDNDLSIISIAIIAGFIFGSLISALFNLPDILKSQHLFFVSSILGGIANGLIIFVSDFNYIWLLRFLTGAFLAGIYPVGMKLTSSHFKENRGLAIGILLSALTAGSGLPYLFNLFGQPDWKIIIVIVSLLAFLCGILVITFIEEGPFLGKNKGFQFNTIKRVYSKKSVKLANYGYFGHMWELYAFWVWIPVFLKEVYEKSNPQSSASEVVFYFSMGSFLVFAIGAISNVVGGYLSDRIGRTLFNIIMLSMSGISGIVIGFFYGNPTGAIIVALIWGATIIPDSPQYSTMVTELSDQDLVGTALTLQTAIGFTITMISVRMMPLLVDMYSWERAFMFLSIGPLLGIISMIALRRNPDSSLIANGRR